MRVHIGCLRWRQLRLELRHGRRRHVATRQREAVQARQQSELRRPCGTERAVTTQESGYSLRRHIVQWPVPRLACKLAQRPGAAADLDALGPPGSEVDIDDLTGIHCRPPRSKSTGHRDGVQAPDPC